MAGMLSYVESKVESIENLVSKHYNKKAGRRPAPVLPKAAWNAVNRAKSDHYTVGIAKREIVPDDIADGGYYIAGYSGPKAITGVHDPQCATAIWIDDNSGKGALVLVSIDCVGFLRYDADAVREQMADWAKKNGCREMHFFGTHDHAGADTMGVWGKLPKSGRNKKFIELMREKICDAIKTAYINRKCGDLFFGQIEEPEGYHDDYRLPKVYSTTLTRFRFVPKDGGKEAYLVNYAAHPGMLGSGNTLMSADWVYWFREDIYKKANAEVIFINGLIGGLVYPHEEKPDDQLYSTELAGHRIAELALAVKDERKLEPKISTMSQDIYLTVDNTMLTLACILKIVPTRPVATGRGRFGLSVKTSLNYFTIGDTRILTVPGEMFPELAYGGYLSEEESASGSPDQNPTPLLEIAGDKDLIMFGLGDDELAYFIPPNDYFLDEKRPYFKNGQDRLDRKHYEETVCVGKGAAQQIADAFAEMLKVIKK
ncbi:MAG: hypothetical protein FWF08_01700 [Oscillospiraceae bacterium]|nr:hypothetical protein [Oscillospiraceae bacterium]